MLEPPENLILNPSCKSYDKIIGHKFGRLLVLEYIGYRIGGAIQYKQHFIKCRCDCKKNTYHPLESVKRGDSKSCGCLKIELDKENWVKHRKSNSRTYRAWMAMKMRCFNPKNLRYDRYGGRGITVCERWINEDGFLNFLEDMGEVPEKLSLERVDVNGNYCPENCCYANIETQSNNKVNIKLFAFNGEMLSKSQIARRIGMKPYQLLWRLNNGWEWENAISEPIDQAKSNIKIT